MPRLPNLKYPAVVLAREAMATRFELVLPGTETARLRAAGEEALDEIERIESALSLYRPDSEIARVNSLAARQPVKLSQPVFRLLQQARQLWQETRGAFDITIAPLARCWGFLGGAGALPSPAALAEARQIVGMDLVELDDGQGTVRFQRPGVMLDLGAIGKGYAIEMAVRQLGDCGIANALLHGGTSSVHGLGHPPDDSAWRVAIEAPAALAGGKALPLAVAPLVNEGLSVSAVWGKSFAAGGRTYGHILDPRSGQPADSALLAAVVYASDTEADALSTALLLDGKTDHDRLAGLRPGLKTLVLEKIGADGRPQLTTRGKMINFHPDA